jgi:hypothetical protein
LSVTTVTLEMSKHETKSDDITDEDKQIAVLWLCSILAVVFLALVYIVLWMKGGLVLLFSPLSLVVDASFLAVVFLIQRRYKSVYLRRLSDKKRP